VAAVGHLPSQTGVRIPGGEALEASPRDDRVCHGSSTDSETYFDVVAGTWSRPARDLLGAELKGSMPSGRIVDAETRWEPSGACREPDSSDLKEVEITTVAAAHFSCSELRSHP
jgi:hypothetical protein